MGGAQGNREERDQPLFGGQRQTEHGGRQCHETAQEHALVPEPSDQQPGGHVEEKHPDTSQRHHQRGEGGAAADFERVQRQQQQHRLIGDGREGGRQIDRDQEPVMWSGQTQA